MEKPKSTIPKDNRAQFRAWTLTVNGTHDYHALDDIIDWQYIVAGKERAPETGQKHLQCYVYFHKRKTFAAVKKMLYAGHWEVAQADAEVNRAYCTKEADSMEIGEFPDTLGGSSGGKKKAEKFRQIIDVTIKGDIDDVIEIDPVVYVQHYHGLKRIKQDHPDKLVNLDDVCGQWLWGEAGAGKSFLARKECSRDLFLKGCNKWWDGYRNESMVLIDDFDRCHAQPLAHFLKIWADRYTFPAEQKGTTVQIRPHAIYVTSNYSIDDLFSYDQALLKAIKRRFKERHIIKPASWDYMDMDDSENAVDEADESLDLDEL